MARYVGHAVDQYGRDIPGAYVTVVGMDGNPAVLTDDFGIPISQPLKTDDYGGYYFNTSDGLYTITTTRSGEIVAKEYNVVIGILPTTNGFDIAIAAEASARVSGDALVASAAAAALASESARAIASEQAEVTRATGVESGLNTRLTTTEGEVSDLQTVSNLGGSIPYDTYATAVADFTAYNSGTAYVVGRRSLDQGAVWINTLASTGVAPPTLPATSNANWQLVKNPVSGQAIVIPITDTGSHTDPTSGATVTNTGIHVWATGTSGTGFHYLYPTDAALAKPYADAAATSALLSEAWAQSPTPPDPDDPTSKSAKSWAGIASEFSTYFKASPDRAYYMSPPYREVAQAEVFSDRQVDSATFTTGAKVNYDTLNSITVAGYETTVARKFYMAPPYRQVEIAEVSHNLDVLTASFTNGQSFSTASSSTSTLYPVITLGNSLTAATAAQTPWPTALGAISNRNVVNPAIGGQTSRHIAGRAGAVAYGITLSSNQIVSGANTLTAINGNALVGMATASTSNVQFLSTQSGNNTFSAMGYLGSVHGTLTRTATGGPPSTAETYTFTPDAGQVLPAYCPPQTAFLVDYPYLAYTHVLWLGRNNYTDPTQVEADVAACRNMLPHKRFVVMGVINGQYPTEYVGQSGYNTIVGIENYLANAYPQNFLNIRRLLIDRGLHDAGITPTPQDLTDIANDTIPTSLRVVGDNLHLTTAAYALIAGWVNSFMITKGF